ncbi:MAG: hypothetical protein Kow0097_02540 [Candidatus Bipolaricaulota bacterium]
MRTLSIVAVCAINLVIGVRYCWLIRRGRISPALAMWVFFTVATVGSLLTYLGGGRYSPLDNILNTADILLVGTVAVWIALYGDRSTRFTRFDLGCLVAVTAIVIAWAVTREHVVAHSAIQAILVIAYFPVVRRLWRAERNTESFTMWIGLLVAPAFSLLSSQGVLATVYAVRAIVCTGLLLLLMLRAERRARAGQAQFAR